MTSFTSATLGEIRPPLNILKEFLATFNRRQKCKAAILSWLDGKHYYGNSWVRITFENLADILGYCRETISKHMRELIFDGLVEDKPSHRFPKDTASEYRLNLEKILETIDYSRCVDATAASRREEISVKVSDIPPECAKNSPTYNKTSLELSENNNVGGEEHVGEPDWDTIAYEAKAWKQAQISRYLEESEEVIEESTDSNGDQFRPKQIEVVTSSEKPQKHELKEVCTELKRLRINPDPCLGVIKMLQLRSLGLKKRFMKAGVIIPRVCLLLVVKTERSRKIRLTMR